VGWNYQCPLEWFYLHQASFIADYNYLNFNKVTANNKSFNAKELWDCPNHKTWHVIGKMFLFCTIFVSFHFSLFICFFHLIIFLGSKLKHGRILRGFWAPDHLPRKLNWSKRSSGRSQYSSTLLQKSFFPCLAFLLWHKLSDKISGNVYVPVCMQRLACSATAAHQSKGTSIN